jgi:hypothetical protein
MYLVPLQLAAALLVVGNEIGEQHREPTGNQQEQHRSQEMSDEMIREETNKI